MMRLTDEDIERAKCVNLPLFLMSHGFELKKAGREYILKDHDSVNIKDNSDGEYGKWFQFSADKGGDNIAFVQEFMGKSFVEAVEILNNEHYFFDLDYQKSQPKNVRKSDISIAENPDSKRVFAYLCKTRGLDYKMISELVKSGKIAQEKNTGNAIFKVIDENNKVVGAEKVGTSSVKKFKGIATGSASGYGFEIVRGNGENALFFESAIDLLSYLQMKNPTNCRLVSMMGVKPTIVAETMKRHGISPKNTFICSDNDTAGNEFFQRLKNNFPEIQRIFPEKNFKDWNDMLRNIPIQKEEKMVTYGNKIWNDATDNRDKTLVQMPENEFLKMCDLLEKSGINYFAYLRNNMVTMAINDRDLGWFKQISGNENPYTKKSDIVHNPPQKNIIGNAEYRYISDKNYISTDRETALKMAEIMAKNNIKFSGRIYPSGNATLTVSGADLQQVNSIQQTVINMRTQTVKSPEIAEFIGNTPYNEIKNKQFFYTQISPEQYKKIQPFIDTNAQFSGVIRDGKIAFAVEKSDSTAFMRAIENAKREIKIIKNLQENGLDNEHIGQISAIIHRFAVEDIHESLDNFFTPQLDENQFQKMIELVNNYLSQSVPERYGEFSALNEILDFKNEIAQNSLLNAFFDKHNFSDEQKNTIAEMFADDNSEIRLNVVDETFTPDEIREYYNLLHNHLQASDVTVFLENRRKIAEERAGVLEFTDMEKAFLSGNITEFMAKSVLKNGIDKVSDFIIRMHNGEDIRKDLAVILLDGQQSFITEKNNEFSVEYGENSLIARYGNAEKTISYEELGDAFLSIIESDYSEILTTEKTESPLNFGLFGNGITVYDTSRTDDETHDFPTVAHISPEGILKIYDDKISAEDMEQIQKEADFTREKFLTEWKKLDITTQFQKLYDRADAETMLNIGRETISTEEKIAKYMPFVFFGKGERPQPEIAEIKPNIDIMSDISEVAENPDISGDDVPLFADSDLIEEIEKSEKSGDDRPFYETPEVQGEQLSIFGDSVPINSPKKSKNSEFSDSLFIGNINRFSALHDEIMRGTGFESGKFRVNEFYTEKKPINSDFANFLKREYGIGGHTGDGEIFSFDHDSKGLVFTHENGEKFKFSWSEVAEATAELIKKNEYLTQDDISEIIRKMEHTLENSTDENEVKYAQKILQKYNPDESEIPEKSAIEMNLYHGTTADFDVFRTDYRGAIWTTTDFESAKNFAGDFDESKVLTVKATLENPKHIEFGTSENWDIDKTVFDAKKQGFDSIIIDFKFTANENSFYKFALENFPEKSAKDVLDSIVDAMGICRFISDSETIADFDRRMRENNFTVHSYVAVFDSSKLEITDRKNVIEKMPETPEKPEKIEVGDKFKNKITGEISEVISLTGALSWYTEDCTVKRESDGFTVTENVPYSTLFDTEKYEYLGKGEVAEKPKKSAEISDKIAFEMLGGGVLEFKDEKFEKLAEIELLSGEITYFSDELSEKDKSHINERAEKIKPKQAENDKSEHSSNFKITDNSLGEGGAKAKFKANIEAIKTLKLIEKSDRPATDEEKEILSKYVGWGGIASAFDEQNLAWNSEFSELKELLTDSEYRSARASVLDAFFTSPTIIDGIFQALENFGFEGGNVLEPSLGVGNFFGCMPDKMRENSKLYGVEIDSISGRIAQKLYPDADISIQGFEKNNFQNGCFDVAVGNVPFGDLSFTDNVHLTTKLHDYFFAEALDKLKNGGILAFVTSAGTLDKKDESTRKMLSEKADLIGAIRLPNTAFKKNAGTEVTTDIIFLQKNDDKNSAEIPDWVHIGETADGLPINRYFAENPDMVLGEVVKNTNPRSSETMVIADENSDLKEQLKAAVSKISATISDEKAKDVYAKTENGEQVKIPSNLRNFSFFEHDRKIYFKTNNVACHCRFDVKNSQYQRAKAFINLRDLTRELIEAQELNKSDEIIENLQKKLNSAYDDFYKKYGLINSQINKRYFSDDVSYNLVAGLEKKYEKNKLIEKSDIFTKRTIKPPKAVEHVESSIEALTLSIAEKAHVDFEYMSGLTGMTEDELKHDLQGEIYKVPHTENEYQTASEYLSGDIREKLKIAQEIAEYDADFAVNMNALKNALPELLKAGDIDVKIGATWLDPKYYEQFMYELFQTPRENRADVPHYSWQRSKTITAEYSEHSGTWHIDNKSADRSVIATQKFGSSKMNAYEIMEHLLNLKEPKVYKTIEVPDPDHYGETKEKRVVDVDATKVVQRRADAIRAEFKKWIFKDSTRREEIVEKYNELFNSVRPREYDGSALTFPLMNADITLHEHQKNAIAHALFGDNTLFAHSVGAGKTFEMIATAMEAKRLGLCTKSLFAVPNHLTEQIGDDFQKLYPSANILVATKKDFQKENRQQLFAKIATGNFDAVIIGHSQLGMIPISKERQEMELMSQIEDILIGIEELKKSEGSKFQIKAMERTKKSLEKQIARLEKSHDDTITFEQLGIDRLFVDEAHECTTRS